MNWVFFAIGSAFFAGLTAILGKLGVALTAISRPLSVRLWFY